MVYNYIDPRIELEHTSSDILTLVSSSKARDLLTCCINTQDREYDLYKWIPAEDLSITI
jgi:hypothetical protein